MNTTRSTSTTPTRRVEVSGEVRALIRRLELGRLLDTLPQRLTLARTQHLPHCEFLEMLHTEHRSPPSVTLA
jgi:hypothetical protein